MKHKLTESQQTKIQTFAAMPDEAPPNEQKTIDLTQNPTLEIQHERL